MGYNMKSEKEVNYGKLQLKDFLNYAYISNLKSSDDKERLAFVVSAANADTNGYDQIYMFLIKM